MMMPTDADLMEFHPAYAAEAGYVGMIFVRFEFFVVIHSH